MFVINFNIFIKPQKLRSETAWSKWEKSKSVFPWMEDFYVELKGNKLRETLKSRLEWIIQHSLKIFLIKVQGIIFHLWKLSSYNFLTQEHCKLIIFDFMSTFFNPPYWKSLQMVSCFTFQKDEFYKKTFCICCNVSMIWFGISKTWAKKPIFDKANVLKIIILHSSVRFLHLHIFRILSMLNIVFF